MKELLEIVYNIVKEWKDNSDNILQFECKDIKERFKKLSGETWGYQSIPDNLGNILNLLQYEHIRENND